MDSNIGDLSMIRMKLKAQNIENKAQTRSERVILLNLVHVILCFHGKEGEKRTGKICGW